jgi:hypothetical protein
MSILADTPSRVEGVQLRAIQRRLGHELMQNMRSYEMYTEQDAADALGISLSRLHELLDQHIFNDGAPRPAGLTFTTSELLLLSYWQRTELNSKVLRMPRRN